MSKIQLEFPGFLEEKLQDLCNYIDSQIEQITEEYAALLGREGDEFNEDKELALDDLNGHIHVN